MSNQQFPSPPAPPPAPPQPPVVSLPGAGQLLKETLKIYKNRFWVFVGIMIIPFLVFLLLLGLAVILTRLLGAPFSGGPWLWFIVWIFGLLFLFIVNLWAGISLFYAIKKREQKIGVKESFTKGWHKIISYWWISILVGLITMAGFFLFIIPGIIFAIWFSLATYVLVSEEIKGIKALFRSKQLVKGYWRKVFWRFLVMGIVVAVIVVPIAIITTIYEKFDFDFPFLVSQIVGALITPFAISFGFLIYENLRGIKKDLKIND